MKPKVGEWVVMQCSDEDCPYVCVIIGPNSRQEKDWSLKNVKCLRCKVQGRNSPMELATNRLSGVSPIIKGGFNGKMTVVKTNNIIGRAVHWEHEGKELWNFWKMCDVWKAIRDEIVNADIGESVFAEKRHPVDNSAYDYGAKLKKVYPFCAGAGFEGHMAYNSVRFCYEVTYRDEDEDARRPVYTEYNILDIPVSLVINFRKGDFENFRDTRRATMETRKAQRQKDAVDKLMERFPQMRACLRHALREDAKDNPALAELLNEDWEAEGEN